MWLTQFYSQSSVVVERSPGMRTVILNRPNALNSLNLEMVRVITPLLQKWEKSDTVHCVVLKGAGNKAFCAGGDIRAIFDERKEEGKAGQLAETFFKEEYQLNHLIGMYKKPVVSLIDGITST